MMSGNLFALTILAIILVIFVGQLFLTLLFAIILTGYYFARGVSAMFGLRIGFIPQPRSELKVVAALGVSSLVTIALFLVWIVGLLTFNRLGWISD